MCLSTSHWRSRDYNFLFSRMGSFVASDAKPEWLTNLERDGFAVVPGVVSTDDCAEFREEALRWLEKFPHGFKRDDRSTWTAEHLPYSIK